MGCSASVNQEPLQINRVGIVAIVTKSIQDTYYPTMMCFGCGPANDKGLQIKSFLAGEFVIGEFSPLPHHGNGGGVLNGGIIATLLDCHSGATVLARSIHDSESNELTESWVTASLNIRYRRPTPLTSTVGLRAQILEVNEREMHVRSEALSGEEVCAIADARWVKVAQRFLHGLDAHPR
jgi:acyl-coenzyme A thioesterase PaaI-like protein